MARKVPNPTGKGGWKKGQSGNPSGRPKVIAEVRDLARTHTRTAVAVLLTVAKWGKSEAARVSAANAILDRGYGKPAQPVFMKNLDSMTEQELVEALGYDPAEDELATAIRSLEGARPAGTA